MAEFIYTMRKARKAHGDKVILDDVTLSMFPGAKIGVVGPTGAGKSTVLKIMAGLDQPSNGDAFLSPGYSVGILEQEPQLDESQDVLGNVQQGMGAIKAKVDRFNEIAEQMATDYSDELMTEMGKLQEEIDHADAWDLDSQLEQAMDALLCPPPDADVSVLSGGERRRVALCKLLLSQPDLLLLDEPTNHLDAESVQWLESHLEKYAGTVVAVTHDRYFLDNVAQWILELDRGRAFPYEGNYSTYLETKQARLKVEGQKDAKRVQVDDNFVNFRQEEVVCGLGGNGHNQTGCCCNQGFRNTTGHHTGVHVAGCRDVGKGADQSGNGSKKSNHRGQVGHC
jgi:ATPase subunit of ABC transporter with duplicated ATPase domains